MRIHIEQLAGGAMAEGGLEIVERKGIGHPDTLCDGMMEAISLALCKLYQERFGRILHHNIDKGLLAAGQVERWFGGGRVVRPMELTIGDRATLAVDGETLPVGEVAVEAARQWLGSHLRFVDPQRHIHFRVALAPGSTELTGLFAQEASAPGANDTSAAVGYYPLTPVERLVLELEGELNGRQFKDEFPESGEDVKIMALRRGTDLELTVAMPLLARFVDSEGDYFARKRSIGREIEALVRSRGPFETVRVNYNALDRPGLGLGGIYLSLLGTSAEDADSGQVGRGNRVNGLIAVCRPLGTEAVAGKNPVSHVGKIYNLLAQRLARSIYEGVEGLSEVYVYLLSRIGDPVDKPRLASVQVRLRPGGGLAELRKNIEEVASDGLAGVGELCREASLGKLPVC